MQTVLFEPESAWHPPSLVDLPSWADARRIAIDTETCDPTLRTLGSGVRRGAYIVGVSFAIEDGPAYYLPLRHLAGGNMAPEQVISYLREQAKVFKGDLVGANLGYDLEFLLNEGIEFNPRHYRDVLIAEVLLDELRDTYALDAVAKRHGLPGKDESLLRKAATEFGVDTKGGLWKLHAKYVGAYAEQDVRLPLLLLRRQERQLEEQSLESIYDLESRVIPVLVRMQRRGVMVDQDRLDSIEKWAQSEEEAQLAIVRRETGVQLALGDVWKPEPISRALSSLGLTIALTPKTEKPSVDREFLIASGTPATDAILRARKVNKLRTTFVQSVRSHMVNGRIHPSFRQIARESEEGGVHGVRFGRMSCAHPNLQQQPARDDFAARWRGIYRPDHGRLWAACDFSQQEPRWTTHFAALLRLPKAREVAAQYRDDPTLDNHKFMAELTGLPRNQAKQIYLGLCYGEGGAKLCRQLQLPTRWALGAGKHPDWQIHYFATEEEARREARKYINKRIWEAAGEEGQSILDQFDARAPYVRALSREASKKASQRGYIMTAGKRILRFPMKKDGTFDWTHKALNRLIQGSGADQMKLAMVLIDENLRNEFPLQLQVHDEVTASVESREHAEKAAQVMVDCMQALVPFRVNTKVGQSWGEAETATEGKTTL